MERPIDAVTSSVLRLQMAQRAVNALIQEVMRIIEEIRRDPELRDLPIILCSGAAESIHPLRGRLAELNVPVVLKPFPLEVLEQQLQATLGTGS